MNAEEMNFVAEKTHFAARKSPEDAFMCTMHAVLEPSGAFRETNTAGHEETYLR